MIGTEKLFYLKFEKIIDEFCGAHQGLGSIMFVKDQM
jgi:hypothetical protein